MLRRRSHYLPVALAAASLLTAGCLGSFGGPPGGPPGPDPGQTMTQTPASPNGNRGSGNPDPGTGGQTTPPPPAPTGPPSPTGTISLNLASSTETLRLNESKDITVNVMPMGGFNGMVQFSLDNPPAGVTGTFNPTGGMMSSMMTTTLTLKVASDVVPNNSMPISIKAVSGTISAATPLTLDVPAELLVSIAKGVSIGTSANPNTAAFGADSIPTLFVAPGTKITFVNQDSINHEIHSDGSLGIAHEGGPLMANGANSYTQTFQSAGTFAFHCHIHPGMRGEIVVK